MTENFWGASFNQRSFFKYKPPGKQTALHDWNRNIVANFFLNIPQPDNSVKPILFIDIIKKMRDEQDQNPDYKNFLEKHIIFKNLTTGEGETFETIKFKDDNALREFFSKYIFFKVEDKDLKNYLCKEALNHFHQGGVIYAATLAVQEELKKEADALRAEELKKEMDAKKKGTQGKQPQKIDPDDAPNPADFPPVPSVKVYFTPTESGVNITEVSQYEAQPIIQEQFSAPKDLAKLECETSFNGKLIQNENGTKGGEINVRVNKLNIKTNPSPWVKFFDTRTILEIAKDFIKKWTSPKSDAPEPSSISKGP